jgi:hypothetical protein
MKVTRQIKKFLLWKRQTTHQFCKKLFWNHNHKDVKKGKHEAPMNGDLGWKQDIDLINKPIFLGGWIKPKF